MDKQLSWKFTYNIFAITMITFKYDIFNKMYEAIVPFRININFILVIAVISKVCVKCKKKGCWIHNRKIVFLLTETYGA